MKVSGIFSSKSALEKRSSRADADAWVEESMFLGIELEQDCAMDGRCKRALPAFCINGTPDVNTDALGIQLVFS